MKRIKKLIRSIKQNTFDQVKGSIKKKEYIRIMASTRIYYKDFDDLIAEIICRSKLLIYCGVVIEIVFSLFIVIIPDTVYDGLPFSFKVVVLFIIIGVPFSIVTLLGVNSLIKHIIIKRFGK
jgi:hypothetical protein